MKTSQWTKTELQQHLKLNINDSYSAAIIVGALYKKIYGEYPELGLSGHQASGIDFLVGAMPDTKTQE